MTHEANIIELASLSDALAIYNLEEAKAQLMKRYQEIEQHFYKDNELDK
jgi:hypothetical protein